MFDFFDDGISAEELAIALGLGQEIAEEERERRMLLQDDEPFIEEDEDPAWYEDD